MGRKVIMVVEKVSEGVIIPSLSPWAHRGKGADE